MNNKLIIIIFLFLLQACATDRGTYSTGESKKSNFAFNESLTKYSSKKISDLANANDVNALCENGNEAKGLDVAVKHFTTKQTSSYYLDIANCYYYKKQLQKSIFYIQLSLSKNSRNASAYNTLGNINIQLNNFSESINAYKKAISLKPSLSVPRYNLSKVYINFGLYNKAITQLNIIYKKSPDDQDLNKMLGIAYYLNEQHRKADKYFMRIDKKIAKEIKESLKGKT